MRKIINSEIAQAAIRTAAVGGNLAFVAAMDEGKATCHALIFQDKDVDAIAKALHNAGITWRQIEVKNFDFYEPRIITLG